MLLVCSFDWLEYSYFFVTGRRLAISLLVVTPVNLHKQSSKVAMMLKASTPHYLSIITSSQE